MAKIIVKGQKKKNSGLVYFLTIVFSIAFLWFGNQIASQNMRLFDQQGQMATLKARVIAINDTIVTSESVGDGSEIKLTDILFSAEITSGARKGEVVNALQNLNSYFIVTNKPVEVGDKTILYELYNEQYATDWVFGEYHRTDALVILAVLFALLILLFGRIKGLQTLISLVFTVLAVFFVFVPSILSGYNIYLWTMITCLFTTVMTLIIVSGVNMKTVSAIIGCMSGIILSAILVIIMDQLLNLTGVIDEDSVFLLMMNPEHPVDLKGIFFGAIVVGAMGAIMDVSMSISSALYEMKEKYSATTFRQLFSSGLTIGRDIMGTMANTLVLAYIGGSLSVVLLLFTYSSSMLDLLNREMVVIEILQALVGSMGILLTLPLTAAVSGLLYAEKKNHNRLRNKV